MTLYDLHANLTFRQIGLLRGIRGALVGKVGATVATCRVEASVRVFEKDSARQAEMAT